MVIVLNQAIKVYFKEAIKHAACGRVRLSKTNIK